MKKLDTLALVLTIVGGLNWGLVGLFRFDLVAASSAAWSSARPTLPAGSSTRRSACRPSTCSAGSAPCLVTGSACPPQPELRRTRARSGAGSGSRARSRPSSLVSAMPCSACQTASPAWALRRTTHSFASKWLVDPVEG